MPDFSAKMFRIQYRLFGLSVSFINLNLFPNPLLLEKRTRRDKGKKGGTSLREGTEITIL